MPRVERPLVAAVSPLFLLFLLGAGGAPSFQDETAAFRKKREADLRSESGWLSLVGLYWLHDGENRFGSDPGDLVLPPGTAPPHAGSFFLENGRVRVESRGGMTLDGKPVTAHDDLQGDDRPRPDRLVLGDLSMYVIRRGPRVGVRVKSPRTEARAHFKGLSFFPADERYRVTARFIPAATPRKIDIATVLGTVEPMTSPGTLEMTIDGKTVTLAPVLEGDDAHSLFIIFRDQTADKETYPAGRFLDTELPRDGKVVLDFNRAYNPPCAFTDFATCPLPPKGNILPVRIEAGEKRYDAPGHSN